MWEYTLIKSLIRTLLMWRIWWAPNNASKLQRGFNLAFKGLTELCLTIFYSYFMILHKTTGMSHLKPVLEIAWHTLFQFTASSWMYHHHHQSFMELVLSLTCSVLTYPEVSSKVYPDSFYQLDSSVSLPWVIYFEAFYLYVVSSFSCFPVICPKLVLFLTPCQFCAFVL